MKIAAAARHVPAGRSQGRDQRRERGQHGVVLKLGDQTVVVWTLSILMQEMVKLGRNLKRTQTDPEQKHQPGCREAAAVASIPGFARTRHTKPKGSTLARSLQAPLPRPDPKRPRMYCRCKLPALAAAGWRAG